MNRFIAILVALIAALGLRPLTARITDLDRTQDTVTIQTATGHFFQFYGCEDYCIGDYVSAILYDNRTPDCRDDIIVSVHYSGYCNYAGEKLD